MSIDQRFSREDQDGGVRPVARMVDLQPCPFCRQPLTGKENRANPSARCKTEGCYGNKMPSVNLDVPSDVAAWNRRG